MNILRSRLGETTGRTRRRLRVDAPEGSIPASLPRPDGLARPTLFSTLKERHDKRLFRREVAVERRLRHTGSGKHLLCADGANSSFREELLRRVQDAVSRLRRFSVAPLVSTEILT